MLSFSITSIQKTQSFVTLILKVPLKVKKSIRNLFFLSFSLYFLLDLIFALRLEEKEEEVLKGHFKNISERNIKKTTAFKRDPSCQTKSKVALHNDYLIA
jgi:hypothetical protein